MTKGAATLERPAPVLLLLLLLAVRGPVLVGLLGQRGLLGDDPRLPGARSRPAPAARPPGSSRSTRRPVDLLVGQRRVLVLLEGLAGEVARRDVVPELGLARPAPAGRSGPKRLRGTMTRVSRNVNSGRSSTSVWTVAPSTSIVPFSGPWAHARTPSPSPGTRRVTRCRPPAGYVPAHPLPVELDHVGPGQHGVVHRVAQLVGVLAGGAGEMSHSNRRRGRRRGRPAVRRPRRPGCSVISQGRRRSPGCRR